MKRWPGAHTLFRFSDEWFQTQMHCIGSRSFAHALKLTSNANSNANSMTNSMLAERAGSCTACSVWGAISVKYSGLVVALKALRTADPRQHGGQGVAAYPATIGRAIVVIGLPGEATMKAA